MEPNPQGAEQSLGSLLDIGLDAPPSLGLQDDILDPFRAAATEPSFLLDDAEISGAGFLQAAAQPHGTNPSNQPSSSLQLGDIFQDCMEGNDPSRSRQDSDLTSDGQASGQSQSHSRRRYTPEELRARRNEQQRRYRAERKAKKDTINQQLEARRIEAERLRQENAALAQNATVMQRLRYFWDDLLGSIYSTAGSVGSMTSGVSSGIRHAVYANFVSRFYEPSDEQLISLLQSTTDDQLVALTNDFAGRVNVLIKEWLEKPDERPHIEARLEKMQRVRGRCAAHMLRMKPKVAPEVFRSRLMPPGPNGTPNPIMYDLASALNMTEQQLQDLEVQWRRYSRMSSEARKHVDTTLKSASAMSMAMAVDPSMLSAAGMCAALAADGYLNMSESVKVLEQYPAQEAGALLDLSMFYFSVLTREQRMMSMAICSPYVTDLLQLCTVLFENGTRENAGLLPSSTGGDGAVNMES